jgi:acyl carrier protein
MSDLPIEPTTIAITATFMAEPVERPLVFWLQKLALPARIAFAPYHQVFQQLLDPASLLSSNRNGVNLLLIRLEDWQGDEAQADEDSEEKIERNVRDLISALTAAAERSPMPHLVCLCPASPTLAARRASFFKRMEDLIVSELAETLGLDQVGIHDDFFDLGGNSLLATQISSRLRSAFQIEWPLRAIFESPTVASLAERIETASQSAPGLQVPPIRPVPRAGDLPLSFAQQRVWLLDQLEPGLPTHTVRYYLRLTGPLNVAALEASLSEIVRRHEALRTTFAVKQGQPVQVIAPAEPLSLPVEDFTHILETEREAACLRLVTAEAEHRFDLAQGPILRVSLLRLGADKHLLLLTIHHIAADGWSRGVFIRELALLYQAFAEGKPSPLEVLPIQYADFACWQREHLQGEALEQQLAYWRRQLAGAPATSELPTDRPRPPLKTFRGATQPLILPASLSERLKALSRREEVSLFMTLLAAFKTLLYRYTGQTDILVGTFVASGVARFNRQSLEDGQEKVRLRFDGLALRRREGGADRLGRVQHGSVRRSYCHPNAGRFPVLARSDRR